MKFRERSTQVLSGILSWGSKAGAALLLAGMILRSESLQSKGLLVLIITPIIRVLANAGFLYLNRDRAMFGFALITLAFIGLGLWFK